MRVEFAAGGYDEMTPVKGWAALAVVVPVNQRSSTANETVIAYGAGPRLVRAGAGVGPGGTGLTPIPSSCRPCPPPVSAGGAKEGGTPEQGGGISPGVSSSPTSIGAGASPGQPSVRSGSALVCAAQVVPTSPALVKPVPGAVPGASSGSSSG